MWLPILKALVPIAVSAIPAFTRKSGDPAESLVSQQISELQDSVKTNAESVSMLAKALEEAVKENEKTMRRFLTLAISAAAFSICALAFSAAVWLR